MTHTSSRPAGGRLGVGVGLLVLALVLFGGSRLLSNAQLHAYDHDATPAATYHLTAGKTYQLSSATPVKELVQDGLIGDGIQLTCTARSTSGAQSELSIESTKTDDRNLHLFATFRADTTGAVTVVCDGLGAVFVDDADNAEPDYSGLLMLLSIVFGVVGVSLALSGAYALSEARRDDADQDGGDRHEEAGAASGSEPTGIQLTE